MDSDMDIDFSEVSDDRVQSFLSKKLEETRLHNGVLETVLKERQQALAKSLTSSQKDISIENIWKKIFNCKYGVGFELSSTKLFENVRVVLTCDFEESLSYKVQTYDLNSSTAPCTAGKNCQEIICGLVKKTHTLQNKAYVTVSFNLPQFTQKLNYDLSGYVICTLDEQDVDFQLPNIQLLSKDTVFQTNWTIERNSLPNFLTMVSCSQIIDLVICLPEEWKTPLVSTFEINCSLTYVPLMDKGFFVAKKVSDVFDNTLVTMHPHDFQQGSENDIFINVYTADDQQLFAFLHHLLSCIPNSIIFPSMFYQSMLMCRKKSYKQDRKEKLLENFEKGMQSDIDHSYYYARMGCWKTDLVETNTYKFNQQRQKLSEQECKTDYQYLEAQNIM